MKILIVEDEPTAATVLASIARSLGHCALIAADGADALAELDLHADIDVVFGDWHLPDRTGPDLCREIQTRYARFLPFIFISGDSDRARQLDGMRAGAIGYMVKPIHRHDLEMQLLAAGRVLALHRELAARRQELEDLVARLALEARHDPVLNIPNRASFDDEGPSFHAHAVQQRAPYAAAMLDVDWFKEYNDSAGHPAGDLVLRRVAAALARDLRGSDRIFRYGGDEIAILLPAPDAQAAGRVVDRLRARVRALEIPHPASPNGVVTVSAGVAMFDPATVEQDLQPDTFAEVIRRADRALFRAKDQSKDNVALAAPRPWVAPATSEDRAICVAIRAAVFIDEQGVPARIEQDGRDDEATLVLARIGDEPVGTARVRLVGQVAKAERVAVLADRRRSGVGAHLMAALEAVARRMRSDELRLHAQVAVAPFYERIGYERVGEPFDEAGIPHVQMTRRLPPEPA